MCIDYPRISVIHRDTGHISLIPSTNKLLLKKTFSYPSCYSQPRISSTFGRCAEYFGNWRKVIYRPVNILQMELCGNFKEDMRPPLRSCPSGPKDRINMNEIGREERI